jgi:predicted O-linked N-acetylglucosamine transferase (SPINDLY family)
MISTSLSSSSDYCQKQASLYFNQGDYYNATSFYKQAIELEPDIRSYYWHLGLSLLLQGEEEEAQATWFMAIMENPEQVEIYSSELAEFLQAQIIILSQKVDITYIYSLRWQIQEIQPANINNLLHLVNLAIELEKFSGDDLVSWEVIELFDLYNSQELDINLLMEVCQRILDYEPLHLASLKFAETCIPFLSKIDKFFAVLLVTAVKVAYSYGELEHAVKLGELCLQFNPDNTELLKHLAAFYQKSGNHIKAIETARRCYALLENEVLVDRVYGNHLLLKTLMNAGGYWHEVETVLENHQILLNSLVTEQPAIEYTTQISRTLLSAFFFAYLNDNPIKYRPLMNKLGDFCQKNLQKNVSKETEWYANLNQERLNQHHQPNIQSKKCLKVGYISSCFRQHSVGWLARWLFEYHDREDFELYGYFVNYNQQPEPLQEWYINQFKHVRKLGMNSRQIAETIYRDEIDILIDLDSLTVDITCEVMALKPAKIQVTWLGWDASGIPAIDYYIADPYVLPKNAQAYYSEKIWRLPQSYIAVDGFEVGVPTLRREDLDIPDDAVIYLSSQGGCKRHPDTIRLQMQILKALPNSYFLIKGLADAEAIQSFFTEVANAEGVECDRLRFLPMVSSEAEHRANLGIADVVLDTYPYNGATTTLETLWMGIPLVTRVGEQFAARNSYTMMMNAGISEGIAWTDEEYIEWGIKLGTDLTLRQQVAWKLRQSRHSAPLWNAKQFTREMENAYEQMWQIYVDEK